MQINPVSVAKTTEPAPVRAHHGPDTKALPPTYFDALRSTRVAANDALEAIRALDYNAPLSRTPEVEAAMVKTRGAVAALRGAFTIEGLPQGVRDMTVGNFEALSQAHLLFSGTAKMGGPAKTSLVLDRLDTELSTAWVNASRILVKTGQPVE